MKIKVLFLALALGIAFPAAPSWPEPEKSEKAKSERNAIKGEKREAPENIREPKQKNEKPKAEQVKAKSKGRKEFQEWVSPKKPQAPVRLADERTVRLDADPTQSVFPEEEPIRAEILVESTGHSRKSILGKSPSRTVEKYRGPVFRPNRAGYHSTQRPEGGHLHSNDQTHVMITTDEYHQVTSLEHPNFKAQHFRPNGIAGHIEHGRTDGSKFIIERAGRWGRHVEEQKRDGTIIVTEGHLFGYVERHIGGRMTRTYLYGTAPVVRNYRTCLFYGRPYYVYLPPVYYGQPYYLWLNRSWQGGIVYNWGPHDPWRPWYGAYWTPMPFYPAPVYWLTDYAFSAEMVAAYQQLQDERAEVAAEKQALEKEKRELPDHPTQDDSDAISPQMKNLIAAQVKRQMELDRAAALAPPPAGNDNSPLVLSTPPAAVDPNFRFFVVSSNITLITSEGERCGLTPGDIIERHSSTPSAGGLVPITVVNSKPGSCPPDTSSTLTVEILQDMHNQFRAQIQEGIDALSKQQGQSGIPAAPPSEKRDLAEGKTKANQEDIDFITKQQRDADQAESDVKKAITE